MNLRDYFRVLRRGWWVLVGLTIVGALAGALISVVTPPSYRSTATVFVSIDGAITPNDLQQGNVFALQRTESYSALVGTAAVLTRVQASVDGSVTLPQLQRALSSSVRDSTSVIDITAAADDPENAAEWAGAAATALGQEVRRIESGSDAATSPVDVVTVQPAEVPTVALSPQPRYNLVVGAVVGLVLGLAIVVTVNAFDTRLRTLGDLPRISGLATLTSVPAARARSRRGAAGDPRREAFRTLRANLQFGARLRGSIAVTTASSSSQVQAFCDELAKALAEIGAKVVVVDLDLRQGVAKRQGRRRGETPSVPTGVADVLISPARLNDVLLAQVIEPVVHIGPGNVMAESPQQLSTDALSYLLQQLDVRFDYVLLACPPITERSESVVAAAHAGRALVVLEAGTSTQSEFLFALELLSGVGVPSVSVAIDHVTDVDLSMGRRAIGTDTAQTAVPKV